MKIRWPIATLLSITTLAALCCFPGAAQASGDKFVCSVEVITGFARDSDTALPETLVVRVKVELSAQPYCQGAGGEIIWLSSPTLESIRNTKKQIIHAGRVRNALQAVLSSLLTFEIASAQGIPFNQAVVVQTDAEAEKPNDFGFQGSRPASTQGAPEPKPGSKLGSGAAGYACLTRSQYQIGDGEPIATVADIHRFDVHLFSRPYCQGKQILRRSYEFGPDMQLRGRTSDQIFRMNARYNAGALMHALDVALVEASAAGQWVEITHGERGVISNLKIKARPRDLVKEVKTIAQPGGR